MMKLTLALLVLLSVFAFQLSLGDSESDYSTTSSDSSVSSSDSSSYSAAVSSSSTDGALIEFTNVAIVGAGWAGTYSAWRLANASNWLTTKIRVYEKLNRIGGRAFFVDKTLVPEMADGNLEENLGSYRFNAREHPMITALTHTVFNVPTRCFSLGSYISETNLSNCPNDQNPVDVYARGVFLNPAQQQNSANWPFNIAPISWTSLANRPDPYSTAVFTAFPFFTTANYPNLTSCDDVARWDAVRQVTDRMKLCAVGDCNVPGQNPVAIPIKYFTQNLFPNDYFALVDAQGGEYLPRSLYQTNVYAGGVSISFGFGFTGCPTRGALPMQQVLEGGGRKGYATVPNLMAAAAAADQHTTLANMVKFGYQMYAVRKWGSRYLLKFTNGKTVIADKVILNVGMWNYQKHLDKHDNILFPDPAVQSNLTAIYAMATLTATKTFLHYPLAWWIKAGLIKGQIVTDETFKLIRFHGGHVVCANSSVDSCHGFLFASYQLLHLNEQKSLDYVQFGPDQSSNLYVLRRSSARDSFIMDLLHTKIMAIVSQGGIVNFTDTIAPPTYGIFANWFEDPWNRCGAYPGAYSVTAGQQELTAIRPLGSSENVFIAQIDWMTSMTGFAEAPLVMAERIMHRFFSLARPSWLPDAAWYNFVVGTANM